ncbi:GNAT family N-acetyltransferase [Nocardia pseudovaccinii]|uniref:GNAT family N-acetyltransferase n=1 Tax=Nocardia pseudovaccinii TaxID=189540 RepID=UPI003D8BD898
MTGIVLKREHLLWNTQAECCEFRPASMVGCMKDDVSVWIGTATDARDHFDSICTLYEAAFSAPPFVWPESEAQRHREMLDRMIGSPTFGIALAESAGTLIGFAYGDALSTETRWWEGFQAPVAAEVTRESLGRTFAVIDLAVEASVRRRGIGRRLLDTLLDSRTEERATLAVQPQAEGSHAFYDALGGWQLIGRQDTPAYVSPQFDIYLRVLKP